MDLLQQDVTVVSTKHLEVSIVSTAVTVVNAYKYSNHKEATTKYIIMRMTQSTD